MAGVAVLILDKVDFRAKKTNRDKLEHCIFIKESMHQADSGGPICVCIRCNRSSSPMMQKLRELTGEIDKSNVIVKISTSYF